MEDAELKAISYSIIIQLLYHIAPLIVQVYSSEKFFIQ